MDKQKIILESVFYKKIECIYFLIKNKEIVYIWKTKDFYERISMHARFKEFDSYYFIETPEEKQSELENFYIIKFNPKHNKTINRLEGYITIQESLKKYWLWKVFIRKNINKIKTYSYRQYFYFFEKDILFANQKHHEV